MLLLFVVKRTARVSAVCDDVTLCYQRSHEVTEEIKKHSASNNYKPILPLTGYLVFLLLSLYHVLFVAQKLRETGLKKITQHNTTSIPLTPAGSSPNLWEHLAAKSKRRKYCLT